MELSSRQEEILRLLVDEYRESDSPATGATLADAVGVHVGAIQREMQTLKALGLVESLSGRGYQPTVEAFEALRNRAAGDIEGLVLAHGYDRIPVTVHDIAFLRVDDPDRCRAKITFGEPVSGVEPDDPVVIGPTPHSALVVAGRVERLGDEPTELFVDVAKVEAPVEE